MKLKNESGDSLFLWYIPGNIIQYVANSFCPHLWTTEVDYLVYFIICVILNYIFYWYPVLIRRNLFLFVSEITKKSRQLHVSFLIIHKHCLIIHLFTKNPSSNTNIVRSLHVDQIDFKVCDFMIAYIVFWN